MRRAMVVAAFLVALVAGSWGLAGPAQAQEPIREPIAGVCVRPLIGEGGILNLPLIDIPGQRIPNQSLELTVGGQYRECKV
jgi:hypothetical protein